MAKIIGKGKFLRLVDERGWEYADRPRSAGIVCVVATYRTQIVLVGQYRHSHERIVISLPGGLVEGGRRGRPQETVLSAAHRELREETGFGASRIRTIARGAASPGMTNEIVTLCRATGLRRLSDPTGDGDEALTIHLVSLAGAPAWLAAQERGGHLIDCKVYMGLHFLSRWWPTRTAPKAR